jgi:hypothetical protein
MHFIALKLNVHDKCFCLHFVLYLYLSLLFLLVCRMYFKISVSGSHKWGRMNMHPIIYVYSKFLDSFVLWPKWTSCYAFKMLLIRKNICILFVFFVHSRVQHILCCVSFSFWAKHWYFQNTALTFQPTRTVLNGNHLKIG